MLVLVPEMLLPSLPSPFSGTLSLWLSLISASSCPCPCGCCVAALALVVRREVARIWARSPGWAGVLGRDVRGAIGLSVSRKGVNLAVDVGCLVLNCGFSKSITC